MFARYLTSWLLLVSMLMAGCDRRPENTVTCSFDNGDCIYIEGRLNDEDIINIQKNPENLNLVILNTAGGRGYIGTAIGKTLFEHDIPVLTLNNCSSACAENILPGAKFVISKENTRSSRYWLNELYENDYTSLIKIISIQLSDML